MLKQLSYEEFLNSFLIKVGLCIWIGIIIIAFLVLFWPPLLNQLVSELGIQHYLQQLQNWLGPFFTANYQAP